MDTEVHREIWQGRLPLCFNLNSDDVIGITTPDPYFMMAPRVSYFPLILDRVVKYFNRFVDQSKDLTQNMWLDYDGQPIKWHHPIGLSWDMHGSVEDLPWRLILHFSRFPSEHLVQCNTKSAIESTFMSTIKEADGLKHKGSVVRTLVKKECNQLWSGLANDKFELFWQVNRKLMERSDNEFYKSIPFRLYLPDNTFVQKIVKPYTSESHIFITGTDDISHNDNVNQRKEIAQTTSRGSEVINFAQAGSENLTDKTNDPNIRWTTILDLIQVCFKNRLVQLLEGIDNGKDDDDKETKVKKQLRKDSEISFINTNDLKYKFLTHGIEIPLDTPLQWLSENMSYPDNFLNICAVLKEPAPEY